MIEDKDIKFLGGFDLAAEYKHLPTGRNYKVRTGAHKINTSADYFTKGVVPFIGTVTCADYAHFTEFPPKEIVEYFSKPGAPLVGARYEDTTYATVVYDGPVPEIAAYPDGSTVTHVPSHKWFCEFYGYDFSSSPKLVPYK